jgi:hypothetical protein
MHRYPIAPGITWAPPPDEVKPPPPMEQHPEDDYTYSHDNYTYSHKQSDENWRLVYDINEIGHLVRHLSENNDRETKKIVRGISRVVSQNYESFGEDEDEDIIDLDKYGAMRSTNVKKGHFEKVGVHIKKIIYCITRLPVVPILKLGGRLFLKLLYYIFHSFIAIYNFPIVGPYMCICILIYLFMCKYTQPLMLYLIEILHFIYKSSPDLGVDAALTRLMDFATSIGVTYLLKSLSYFTGIIDTAIEKVLTIALSPITKGLSSIMAAVSTSNQVQQQTQELLQNTKSMIENSNIETRDLLLQTHQFADESKVMLLQTQAMIQQYSKETRELIVEQYGQPLKTALMQTLLDPRFMAIMSAPAMAGLTDIREDLSRISEKITIEIHKTASKLLKQQQLIKATHTNQFEVVRSELNKIFLENLATHHVTTHNYQLMIRLEQQQQQQQAYITQLLSNADDTRSALEFISYSTERNLQYSQIYLDRFNMLTEIINRVDRGQQLTEAQTQHCLDTLLQIKRELELGNNNNKKNNLHKAILDTIHYVTTKGVIPAMISNHPRLLGRGGNRTKHFKKNVKKSLKHKKSLKYKKYRHQNILLSKIFSSKLSI